MDSVDFWQTLVSAVVSFVFSIIAMFKNKSK